MKKSRASLILWLAVTAVAVSACAPNQRILNSASENRAEAAASSAPVNSATNTAPAISGFKQDIESMRTADFKFIVVLRRKDGAKMEADDKETIGRITGAQVNRRKISDEGKAVIIGSNFPFLPGMLEQLTGKFKMEDYSKPDSGPLVANTNEEP